MTYFGKHKGSDPKPEKQPKKQPKPLKRTPLKKSNVKIKKHSDTTLHALFAAACVVFQRRVRKRDHFRPCISCGVMLGLFHAGHRYKKELYSGLVFEEELCHSQCETCNVFKQGNEKGYIIGLTERIGAERVAFWESIKDSQREYKYTREELNTIINKYKNV
mgnify:FL=1